MNNKDELIETVNYRGFSFPIYHDEYGSQFYTVLDGKEVGFGSFNTDYLADLQYLVDDKLDTIKRFDSPYYGAKLA